MRVIIYNAIKKFNKNMFEHCTGLAYSVFPFELQDHNTTNMRNMIILIIRCMPISKSITLNSTPKGNSSIKG